MSMVPQKHLIANFPATSGWRHEYYISAFHKILLLSRSELTPRLMRASKTDLPAVVSYFAY